MALEDLRQNDMMAHLLAALEKKTDIGHYGRLVFAMVGRHSVYQHIAEYHEQKAQA